MKRKVILTIIAITILTILTRFIKLDSIPPHLSNDEISIAYDAYSISKTGYDEHNNFLPLSFQSHGTYKAPLAIYLTIPTTILLGNNNYSARLPSAILGSLTVFILGFLIYELSKNYLLALIGCLVITTAPWHIYSSRMILESNIALFFLTLGIYLFFFGLNHRRSWAILASFSSFSFSMYTYHTEWGLIPLLILSLLFFYRRSILKMPATYFGIGLFALLLTPLFIDFWHNLNTNARANTEIILHDPFVAQHLSNNDLNIFQKGQALINVFWINYSNYTNPGYLFFNGLGLLPSDDPFQVGLFLFPLLPCLIIGLIFLRKYFPNHAKFIYTWALISPIIPSLTIGGVNNVRNLVSIIPYTIIITAGIIHIWNLLKKHQFSKFSLLLLLIPIFYFMVIYYHHFPFEKGENYQYGYQQIAEYIKPRYNQFEKIVIDPRFGSYNIYSGVPHLYIPYYTNLNPNQLLKRQDNFTGLFFDKYEIRSINWNQEAPKSNYLYVVPVSNKPTQELKNLININLPNYQPAFSLYTY